jgi:hypothetical protein
MEVQPCALGDAYVRFSSSLERESFLGGIYQITPEYQLHFVKHDEGINARYHNAHREAWVMLLNYPLDGKSNALVAKAVAGFGLFWYWHDTNYMARIVLRVLLKEDAQIPHDVTVSLGMPPRMRSWTCLVFSLKRKNVTVVPDEDELSAEGPLHPLPVGAPRWMGLVIEPPIIIPYYNLSLSMWPLSYNKELFCRLCRVMLGESLTTGSLICAKPARRQDQSTSATLHKNSQSYIVTNQIFIHKSKCDLE